MAIDREAKLTDLTAEEAHALMLDACIESMEQGGDFKTRKISTLTVEEFTKLMVSVQETKTYIQAQREQEIAMRIFKDAEVAAAATPFRVTNPGGLHHIVESVEASWKTDPKAVWMFAMALVKS